MRKYSLLLIVTIILFLLVNTSYFWDGQGFWTYPIFLFLAAVFAVLVIVLLFQIFFIIKEKAKQKPRVYLVVSMAVLLGLITLQPSGLIRFESFESPDLLTADRAGVANCHTILKLKKDHSFYMRQTCFGIEKFNGRYTIDNDTISFQDVSLSRSGEGYKFALVKPQALLGGTVADKIMLYRSRNDTIPFIMTVTKNDLTMGF